MNQTAKKLRDITQNAGVTPGSGKPYSVIATIKSAFGFDSILAPGVLLQFMAAIADEMDELQAEANDANNLRQKLDSAEKKAERRKQHIGYLETALHDKNALLEQRGGTIARLTAENRELRKQVPTECERQILAMWPRFEDGEPVMVGDKYEDNEGHECFASGVHLDIDGPSLVDSEGFHDLYRKGKRVKRPAPKVLDADGVEVKEGDTVWLKGEPIEYKVAIVIDGLAYLTFKTRNGDNSTVTAYPRNLTHTPPDSWERLEEDAAKSDCDFFGRDVSDCDRCPARESTLSCGQSKSLDIIRRAKALAGVEVDE